MFAHPLMVYICEKFHENISNSFQLTDLQSGHEYMLEMTLFNVQRAITPEVGKLELWFMCSAHRLMVFYICVKFHEIIKNCIRVMERTRVHGRNCYVQCSKGNNSKSRQIRVTVHVFCTLSHGA